MRTLDAIVAATRSAEPVTEEELRYAVVAFDVLLYSLDLPADYKRRQQWFVAAEADPREYIGEANDPANEKAIAWYQTMHNAGNESVLEALEAQGDRLEAQGKALEAQGDRLEAPKVKGFGVEAWGFSGNDGD